MLLLATAAQLRQIGVIQAGPIFCEGFGTVSLYLPEKNEKTVFEDSLISDLLYYNFDRMAFCVLKHGRKLIFKTESRDMTDFQYIPT